MSTHIELSLDDGKFTILKEEVLMVTVGEGTETAVIHTDNFGELLIKESYKEVKEKLI